jgi:RimJ/RimL family protein N-acetyltransferase
VLRRRRPSDLDPADMHLRLATAGDLALFLTAASDAEAQRWLGWRPELLRTTSAREPWRAGPSTGGVQLDGDLLMLSASCRGYYVGGVELKPGGNDDGWSAEDMQLGIVVAPVFRQLGFGTELLRRAVAHAHQLLKVDRVVAGCEREHARCAAALGAAGFRSIPGPPRHVLPDGREIDSLWFGHCAPPA